MAQEAKDKPKSCLQEILGIYGVLLGLGEKKSRLKLAKHFDRVYKGRHN